MKKQELNHMQSTWIKVIVLHLHTGQSWKHFIVKDFWVKPFLHALREKNASEKPSKSIYEELLVTPASLDT